MQVDRLIQVVQNTGQNTAKMLFYITVNDVASVQLMHKSAPKKSLTRLKVTATITWFEKNRT